MHNCNTGQTPIRFPSHSTQPGRALFSVSLRQYPRVRVQREIFPISGPISPVERAVLNGFAQMARRDFFSGIEVRDRPGHFQNAVVRARRKTQPQHGRLQQFLALGRNAAVLADQFGWHLRVCINVLLRGEPFELAIACPHHPLANRGGILRGSLSAQFLVFDRGHLDMNIDPVEQRT